MALDSISPISFALDWGGMMTLCIIRKKDF